MDTQAQITLIEMDYTANQLLQLMTESAKTPNGDGWTTQELAAKLDINIYAVRRILHQIKAQGRLVVKNGKREYLDGKMGNITVYTIKV